MPQWLIDGASFPAVDSVDAELIRDAAFYVSFSEHADLIYMETILYIFILYTASLI